MLNSTVLNSFHLHNEKGTEAGPVFLHTHLVCCTYSLDSPLVLMVVCSPGPSLWQMAFWKRPSELGISRWVYTPQQPALWPTKQRADARS